MAAKIFGDTFRLGEFSNQRFLYGNFIPVFLGMLCAYSIIFNTLPITIEFLPLFTLLSLTALVVAFFSQRLSRYIIYRFCSCQGLYAEFLEKDYDLLSVFKEYQRSVGDQEKTVEYERLGLLFSQELLKDFKKIFEENYFTPPSTLEMQELRRHESMFLLTFWTIFWSLVNLLLAFLCYAVVEIELNLFLIQYPINIYSLIQVIFLILILMLIPVTVHQSKAIREHLLYALPLYIKPQDQRQQAQRKIIQGILEKKSTSLFQKEELEYEIREYHRSIFIEELAYERFYQIAELSLLPTLKEEDTKRLVKQIGEKREAVVGEFMKTFKERLFEWSFMLFTSFFVFIALILLPENSEPLFPFLSPELDYLITNSGILIGVSAILITIIFTFVSRFRKDFIRIRYRKVIKSYINNPIPIHELATKFGLSPQKTLEILRLLELTPKSSYG